MKYARSLEWKIKAMEGKNLGDQDNSMTTSFEDGGWL
jgi:hypothetical protein